MTTDAGDETQTTTDNTMTSSSSSDAQFYFRCGVVIIGVVGTAGNAFVIYALVAAKQHKKLPLIVNQNALDLFASFFSGRLFCGAALQCPLHGHAGLLAVPGAAE